MTCTCPDTTVIHPRGWIDTRIDIQPTTRAYALTRIRAGGQAFVNHQGRWWRLDASTVTNPYTQRLPHHVEHHCDQHPPTTDKAPTRPPTPDKAPY